MLSAGLDVGALWTKAVVVSDSEMVGWNVAPTADNTSKAAEDTLNAALEPLKASIGDLGAVWATGAGQSEVPFATERVTDVVCTARGLRHRFPEARGAVDMGGESTLVFKLDDNGDVLDFGRNDKCAAGTGVFLDAMAKVMGVSVEEMGPLSLESTADVQITSTCVAFAESEVVSQVHRQTPKKDILRGIHRSIATRVFGLVKRIGLEPDSLAIGGLARNVGIVTCLQELMGVSLVVPEHPQILSALGAALLAQEKGGTR